jgi:hypothetical protein
VYKEGEIKKVGIVAFEWRRRNLNFLKVEMESIKADDTIKILALEQTLNSIKSSLFGVDQNQEPVMGL